MPTVAITNNTREANTLLPNGVRLVIASIPAKVPESSESSNA
jgi:hypothetical protein